MKRLSTILSWFQLLQKKKSPNSSSQDPSEESIPDFLTLESKVFTEKNGKIYIGKEELSQQMRELLRDQARNFQTMQLYEVINATIIHESSSLALLQSKNFDEVQFAKALFYWNKSMIKMIDSLAK